MSTPILCDMHTHSHHSHDGHSSISEIAQAAMQKGISVFAVTDHCDIQFYYDHQTQERIRASNAETREAAQVFAGQVKILTGIEIGEAIWYPERMREILQQNEYDVVIGSVHAIRFQDDEVSTASKDFSSFDDDTAHRYLQAYYRDVWEMLHTVPCNILAHLSYPFRYLRGKYQKNVNILDNKAQLQEILSYLLAQGIALEMNTAYWGPPYDTYPEDAFLLSLYRSMGGVLVTLGSDAHFPDRLGKDFEKARMLLRSQGLSKYYYFEKGQPIACAL